MKLFFILSISLVYLSCSYSEHVDFRYLAKADCIEDSVLFETVVEEFRYVKLETSPECLIGEIQQMFLDDENVYIVSDEIYCFNRTGKFCYAINRKGRGPGEFIKISSVNLYDGKLYLYDNLQWRILVFSSKDGRFIEDITMPYSVFNAFVFSNTLLMDRGSVPNMLAKNEERVIICPLNNPQELLHAGLESWVYRNNYEGQLTMHSQGFFFTDYYHCTAQKITPNGIENYFAMDIANKTPFSEQELSVIQRQGLSSKVGKYYGLSNFVENNRFIFGMFYPYNNVALVLFDKHTHKTIMFNSYSSSFFCLPPVKLFDDGEYFCGITQAKYICSNRRVGLLKYPNEEVERLIESVQPEDNPIIAFYKFRPIQ